MGFRVRSAGWMVGVLTFSLGIGLLAVASPSRAQETDPGQTIVTQINLVDADLQQAVSLLQRETGANIVIEPSDKPYKRVFVTLSSKPLDVVLRLISKSAGASLRYEDGIYVIGPADTPAAPPKRVEDPPAAPVEKPLPARRRIERIKLQYSRPADILRWLGEDDRWLSNEQRLQKEMERKLIYNSLNDVLDRSPRVLGQHMPTMLAPPANGNTGLQNVPPVVPTSEPTTNAATEPQRAGGPGHEEGQIGGIGGRGGQFGGRGGGGQFGGTGQFGGGGQFGGQGGQFGGQGGQFGGQQGGALTNIAPNTDRIGYDLDNTIIVIGPEDEIRDLREVIRLLDVPAKQLMIKAEFVEVRQDDLRTFGIDWNITRGALAGSTNIGAAGNVTLNYASGNLVAALRTSLVEGRGRIVNSPMVTTTNNVPVTVTFSTSVPVITNQTVFTGQGGGTTVPQINILDVPTYLFVLPRINGDNSISMLVQPAVQDIVSEVANPAGGTIPIVTSQSISVYRRIGNNETMVIGGLVKKNDRSSVNRVPLLSDLPLIGSLFRSTSKTVQDSELLIFVTPTILPDPVSGTAPGGVVGGAVPVP